MFNKNYFSYLFKSKMAAWFGLAGIVAVFCVSPYFYTYEEAYIIFKTTINLAGIFTLLLTFILPIFLFSFIHRKRSCDLTFTLPIKRSEMLFTTITFMLCVCIGVYVCASLMSYIIASFSSKISMITYLKSLLNISFSALVLLTVNTMFYMFANNIIDGIIMLAAYTCIPIAIVATLSIISYKLLISSTAQSINIAMYLSPVAMAYSNHWAISCDISPSSSLLSDSLFSWIYIILLIVYFVLAVFALKKHFVNRKVERADQISNNVEAYPFIINFYLACCLVYLAFATLKGITQLIVIAYVFLFTVYLIALAIYKRKIKFYWKNVGYFMVVALITVGVSRLAFFTKAFGLAYQASNIQTTAKYQYNAYDVKPDLSDVYINWYSCEDGNCSYTGENRETTISVSGTFLVNKKKFKDPTCTKAIQILDTYRKSCIDLYFGSSGGYNFSKGYLTFTSDTNSLSYDYEQILTVDELKELEKLGTVTVSEFNNSTGEETTYSLEEYLKEVN